MKEYGNLNGTHAIVCICVPITIVDQDFEKYRV